MSELLAIGIKINKAIEAIWKHGLTIEELEEFEDYINRQETVMPLTDPSSFQKHGKLFDKAKERIRLLKPVIELKEKEVKK